MTPLPRFPLVLMAGLSLLSACAEIAESRDPQLSDLTLDVPEARSVRVPMPEPEPYIPPKRADRASLWATGSSGFFGDHRAARVGDILTVMIEIDDEAELRNASTRSRSNSTGVDAPTFLGYESKLDRVLPGLKAEDLPSGDLVDLSSSDSFKGQGSIRRGEEIKLKVAAMIVQRLANGNLVIAGRQEVRVNAELRELRVAGIIRPVDIEMSNTIPYEKIAEARIAYGGKGQLSRVQQPRYGADALDVILPY
ncbi:flagellar basal body L-ring protein FlgH [Falsigemmobacter faecalis]|uniref:Flagellar L-ring protein n=1 Tax=Falsigemmobacter faecalis TaxID=2488730 RepID=A0A3P3DQ17_9RHOB|nr:flagellar basal body L-ring protein FlgH [Falsigemmobacter faecalis]RRH75786.1 flagellar basal body L-ring protein FlgH [Falsigemmobacter faecalis]